MGIFRFKGSYMDSKTYCSAKESDDIYSYEIRGYHLADDGAVWMAGHPGLTCYRDSKFTSYKVGDAFIDNNIRDLLVDRKNRLWITQISSSKTRDYDCGLSCYDNGAWINYYSKDYPVMQNAYCLAEDSSGNIWVGTFSSVLKLDPATGKFTISLSGVRVNDISVDHNNHIWVAASDGDAIALRYDGKEWIKYGLTETKATSNNCRFVKVDNKNNVWIGTSDEIIVYDSEAGQFNLLNNKLPFKILADVGIDKDNKIWLVLLKSSISRNSAILKENGIEWETVKLVENSSGSSDNAESFYKISFDSKGNAWIVSYYSGILKLNGSSEKLYTMSNSQFVANAYLAIVVDKYDNIITANHYGLVIYSENKISGRTDAEEPLPFNYSSYTTAYPVPAGNSLTIAYYLDKPEFTEVSIFDALGNTVLNIYRDFSESGQNIAKCDISSLIPGIYYYRVSNGSYTETKPFVVIK